MPDRPRRVIYFDIDSVRPDHLGCYGYHRPTSPALDRVAREGVRFEIAYTSDSPCMPSRCATLTGRMGIHTGVVTHGERGESIRPGAPTIPELLAKSGIRTCSIASFGRHPAPWFYAPWHEVLDPAPTRHFQRNYSHEVNALAEDWLRRHAQEDFFLHLQYWDPHVPYDLPEPVHRAFYHYPPIDYPPEDLIRQHLNEYATPLSARYYRLNSVEDVHRHIQKYDAQIRYTDDYVGRVLTLLEELGILDETLIVITADHGDQQGEYNVYHDHILACEAVLRVPLILRAPRSLPQGIVIAGPVYSQDAVRTVMEYCGVEPHPNHDFRSLLPLIAGKEIARDFVVSGHGLCSAGRCLRTDRWMLRKVYHPGFWNVPPWSLFKIDEDPHEQRDCIAEYPEVFADLYRKMEEWERAQGPRDADPMLNLASEGPFCYDKQITTLDQYARRYLPA
ncbi:MAG: sulfatase [Anaerolineae bacterium]|nr:sulfatase [Anaerolineae bacterium]